ncbi:MAG: SH3 domain-containing protein [Lachnospiraceae bacterium]|nr:SH3 domain-containing protein [Lachnospiraceae bacterium]
MEKKQIDFRALGKKALDFIRKYAKMLIPFGLGVLSCLVVVLALNARNKTRDLPAVTEPEPIEVEQPQETPLTERKISMEENKNEAVDAVIRKYYDCLSTGDMDTLTALCDQVEEKTLLLREEQSKYLSYNLTEVYAQPGPTDSSAIIYACFDVIFAEYPELSLPGYEQFYLRADDAGEYMIITASRSEEETEYLSYATSQEDVIELNNRFTVDYNDKVTAHPELLAYMKEMLQLANEAVGERLAAMNAPEETPAEEQPAEGTEGGENAEGTENPAAPAEPQKVYATTTAKVNVRSSDSENADKLGQAAAGTKLEVLEQQVNGWSKVLFDGKEGYIRSDFLKLVEDASALASIGTVTTKDAVNARTAASQESDRLGVVPQGETLDLIAEEGEWVKVKYQGQVAYIKAEFVTVNR